MRLNTFFLWYLVLWVVLIPVAVLGTYNDGIDGSVGVYVACLWGALANLVAALGASFLSVRR